MVSGARNIFFCLFKKIAQAKYSALSELQIYSIGLIQSKAVKRCEGTCFDLFLKKKVKGWKGTSVSFAKLSCKCKSIDNQKSDFSCPLGDKDHIQASTSGSHVKQI